MPKANALNLWRPDFHFKSIEDIDFEYLYHLGIRKLLIDLDGTLSCFLCLNRQSMTVLHSLAQKLDEARANGWIEDICIFSNVGVLPLLPRLIFIAWQLKAKWYGCFWPMPMKPSKKASRGAMAKIGGKPSETAIIGDQLGTDIRGGKIAGIMTILVDPLPPIPFWKKRSCLNDLRTRQAVGLKPLR